MIIHEPDKLEENEEDNCRTQQDSEQPEAKWEPSVGAQNSTSIIDSSNTNRAEKLASQNKSAERRPEEPTLQTHRLELKDAASFCQHNKREVFGIASQCDQETGYQDVVTQEQR